MSDNNENSNINKIPEILSINLNQNNFSSQQNTTSPDRYINTLVSNRYLIEKELGRGGIGIVYLAKDQQMLSKKVVLKVLLDEKGANEWLKTKFRQEIEALARIDHPGVVGILDTGQMPDKKPYFVMQFIEGVNLRTLIKSQGIELERVANIIKQLGAALRAAHNKNIFHRDLKPENIMLQLADKQEYVKLIDFGVAKVKNSDSGESTPIPVMAGTYLYMSPEQFAGAPITSASDVYALAIIAYEMITGRLPFYFESPTPVALLVQLVQQQKLGPALKPKKLRPTLSQEAEDIILRGLTYNINQRYQHADEFANDLAYALKVESTPQSFFNNSSDDNADIDKNFQNFSLSNLADKKIYNTPIAVQHSDLQKKLSRKIFIGFSAAIVLILVSTLLLNLPTSNMLNNRSVSSIESTKKAINSNKVDLAYWIIVQRYRDGKAYKEPYRLAQEITFQSGDCIKLYFTSQQQGYLYILNEGPSNKDGSLSSWNTLFPTPFSNKGLSELKINMPLEIAGGGEGFCFDKQEGTEKLWLVFSLEKIKLLEDLQQWINGKDKGEIKDATQVTVLRTFIQDKFASPPVIKKDDINKQTTISSSTNIIVVVLSLTHI